MMAEAVEKELDAEQRAGKKNAESEVKTDAAMIALLRSLGFQVKDHMSVYTPMMAKAVEKELEAVEKELEAKRRAAKKKTEAVSQVRLLININHATEEELEYSPGIGPIIAYRIVTYRKQNGPFRHIDDLENVWGVGWSIVYDLKRYWNSVPEVNTDTEQLRICDVAGEFNLSSTDLSEVGKKQQLKD